MVHVPLSFLSEMREFPTAPCLARKKKWQLASRCCWNHARRLTYFLSPSKTCNSAHEQTPLSNDTIDSVLRQRKVGRAKYLSAPPRTTTARPLWVPQSAHCLTPLHLSTFRPTELLWAYIWLAYKSTDHQKKTWNFFSDPILTCVTETQRFDALYPHSFNAANITSAV